MRMIDYRSDNTGRAAPEILDALIRANHGTALGYGGDDYTAALQRHFSELFETAVRVFPVATGTAANALALASLGPSWGNVYCSEVAHINTAEANAAWPKRYVPVRLCVNDHATRTHALAMKRIPLHSISPASPPDPQPPAMPAGRRQPRPLSHWTVSF